MSPAPRRSPLHTALALVASASSLAALVYFGLGGLPTEARAAEESGGPELLEAPARAPQSKVVGGPARPATARLGRRALRAAARTELPEAAPTPEPGPGISVPDVAGKRLWIARKQLSDVGLKMIPREGQRRIPIEDFPIYQVAGDQDFTGPVAAGEAVEVQVEYWAPRFARGY